MADQLTTTDSASAISRLVHWSDGAPLHAARVLVAGSSAANLVLLRRYLASMGVTEVSVVDDVRAVVDRCLETRPSVLLVDLHPLEHTGYEVLCDLRERLPRDDFLPVLVLTSDNSPAARERAMLAGANDFLSKPLDRVEVLQRVRNLIELHALYQGVRHQNRDLQDELDRERAGRRTAQVERERLEWLVEEVIAGRKLQMVFQPILDLASCEVVAVEALARFQGAPPRGPDVWFAEAHSVGLGLELELTAVALALGHLDELPEAQLLSINVSPDTVASPQFADLLAGVAGHRILVELTECTVIGDYPTLLDSIDSARRRGVRIAVDDAGAGYAGLQQIVRLRPDVIKLDRSIIQGIDRDPVRRALATSLVAFGHDTDSAIVAEGIEEPAELATLQQLGVTWGQGYLLGRPARLAHANDVGSAPLGASSG